MSSVIVIGAIAGSVVGAGSSMFGIFSSNKSQIKAFKKQMENIQLNYNYNQASLDKQERSLYDSAVSELFGLAMNSYQNNAQIEAALAETGIEGRSTDKIKQAITGQVNRQQTAIKEDYKQNVWDIRNKKEALYISTVNEIEAARDNLSASLTSGSNAFVQVLGGALQGATVGALTAGAGSALFSAGAGATTAGATTGATAGATTAGATTAGATTGAIGAGAIGAGASSLAGTTTSATKISSVAAQSVNEGFLGNFNKIYTQQKSLIDFFNKIGEIGTAYKSNHKRGGYYY